MTLEKRLEKKVRDYLIKGGNNFIDNSIFYSHFKKDAKRSRNGTAKPMHIVSFEVLIYSDSKETQICSIWIDAATERLEFLLTPHILEDINE